MFEKIISSNVISESKITISNRTFDKLIPVKDKYSNVNITHNNSEVAKNSDVLFLCVKPLDIKSVLLEIYNNISPTTHLVSLNGSVLFEQLEKVANKCKISKAIPSVTAEVNLSQTLVCHNSIVSEKDKNILKGILSTFGNVIELPETEIGMGSELVSCMPGFIASLFNEICIEAQNHTTLAEDLIIEMVKNTMYGTSKLLLDNNLSFEEVIIRVATKGGITEEGTKVIHEHFPKIASELFHKTIQKRIVTTENARNQFNS